MSANIDLIVESIRIQLMQSFRCSFAVVIIKVLCCIRRPYDVDDITLW